MAAVIPAFLKVFSVLVKLSYTAFPYNSLWETITLDESPNSAPIQVECKSNLPDRNAV
jgi:hypothetical protein